MHINKPSVTKMKLLTELISCKVLAAALNSDNLQNFVKCLYPCLAMWYFMIVTRKTLTFRRHRNRTLDNFIKLRSILLMISSAFDLVL